MTTGGAVRQEEQRRGDEEADALHQDVIIGADRGDKLLQRQHQQKRHAGKDQKIQHAAVRGGLLLKEPATEQIGKQQEEFLKELPHGRPKGNDDRQQRAQVQHDRKSNAAFGVDAGEVLIQ